MDENDTMIAPNNPRNMVFIIIFVMLEIMRTSHGDLHPAGHRTSFRIDVIHCQCDYNGLLRFITTFSLPVCAIGIAALIEP
jgi:hypothetical protein